MARVNNAVGGINKQPAKNNNIWPSVENAFAMIQYGNRYSSDRLYYMSRIILVLTITFLVSLFGNIVLLPSPPVFRYILVDNGGAVLPQIPLDQPNHDNEFITNWTIDAVTRLYSFDFLNYRGQLQSAQKNLTQEGWVNFQAAMQDSGNFNSIIQNNFALTAAPIGKGKIIKEGMIDGKYAWKVEFPMQITYRSSGRKFTNGTESEGRTISDSVVMTVVVTRVGVFLNHSGLGIKSMVAVRQKSQ